jgi:hypothetical protein
MKRTPANIKADIKTLKETLSVVEGAEKKMIEEGIADLEAELAEAEKGKEKPEKKPKVKKDSGHIVRPDGTIKVTPDKYQQVAGLDIIIDFPKSKIEEIREENITNIGVDKDLVIITTKDGLYMFPEKKFELFLQGHDITIPGGSKNLYIALSGDSLEKIGRPLKRDKTKFPERNKYQISPDKRKQDVGHLHSLHKIDDNTYTLIKKKGEIAEFDFVKKNSKWTVECRDLNKKSFNTLQGAINFVAREIYNKDVKPILEKNRAAIKAAKEWREKNPTGKSPAKRDVKKGVTKAVVKITKKAKKGKDITSDVKTTFITLRDAVKAFSKFANEIDDSTEKEIDSLIAELQKLKRKV